MKKSFFVLFILFAISIFAFADIDTKDGTAITTATNIDGFSSNISDCDGQAVSSGASCDDCSGATLFSAHMENDDDVTQGTPCGCSDGDTTIARTGMTYSSGQAHDGTYSIYKSTSSNQYARVSVSSRDTFDEQDGHVTLYVYVATYVYGQEIFYAQYDSNNYVKIYMNQNTTGWTPRAMFCTAASCDYLNIATDKALNTWTKIDYYFKTGVAGNDHKVVHSDEDGSNPLSFEDDDDLTAWAGSATYFEFSSNTSGTGEFYLDTPSITNNSGY